MGLNLSPSIFTAALSKGLAGLDNLYILDYFDDLLIFNADFSDHLRRLDTVLTRLETIGITASPMKSKVATQKVKFLGHTLTPNKIQPLDKNIDAIVRFPRPTNVREVQSFAGHFP